MSIIFKKNKLISLLLAFVLTFSMLISTAIPAYATDINSSGNSGKSKVVTTVTPAKFNVTVPYVLPISIDSDQNVFTADNVAISNNSNGPIKVSEATLTTNGGWELVEDGTDFSSVPVNSQKFSMSVLNTPVLTSGNLNTESFGTINGNTALSVTYDADAAVQGEEVSATNIANVLFTIEWDNIEITSATVSKTALQSFAKTVTTFQKTSERLNIDDVKATEGLTKIDDGATDKSIYAWSDSNGNGYWWTDAMIAHLPDDCSDLFFDCINITYIDLSDFDSSNVVNMRNMFYLCTNLESVNLKGLNTENVVNTNQMFRDNYSLTSLDLSTFNVENVEKMYAMFYMCTSLKTLDLSSFNAISVKDVSWMFAHCISLTSLNLSNFTAKSAVNTSYMFHNCRELSTLDLSGFTPISLEDTTYMFQSCDELCTIYVSNNFVLSDTESSDEMFNGCTKLVGGNGTKYNSSYVDKTYARIDTAETPGYFTCKAAA